MDYELSKDWFTNGEQSLKLTGLINGYCACILNRFDDLQSNQQISATLDVLNNSTSNVYLRLVEVDNNQYNDVIIPNKEGSQKISISKIISTTSNFQLVLIIRDCVSCYVDNIVIS